MTGKQDLDECEFPSSHSKNPNVAYSRGHHEPYGTRPRGLGPLINYICHCERTCVTSPSKKSNKKNPAFADPQNDGTKKMFYWVINDPQNSDPRVQDIICVDSNENRPLKPVGFIEKPNLNQNGVYWQYVSDGENDLKGGEADSRKMRSVKNRRPTAAIRKSNKIKKHLRNRIKELNLQESSDENISKFDFPEDIREPQRGDLICWLGKSKDGPLSGVRAIWEAEEMTGEPGKICWLGREVTDRETNGALRYDYRNVSKKHSWKSRPGYCLPPVSSLNQKPVDLLKRYSTFNPNSSSKKDNSSEVGSNDDKLHLSISAYNIPSELFKSVSWQDITPNKARTVRKYN